MRRRNLLLYTCLILFFIIIFLMRENGGKKINPETSEEKVFTSLEAFVKLHGFVPYFQLSDEASELYWE